MSKYLLWFSAREYWATAFIRVWDGHPDLVYEVGRVKRLVWESRLNLTSMEEISNDLRDAWERKKRQQTYSRTDHQAASAVFDISAFAFDDQEPPEGLQEEDAQQPKRSNHKRKNLSTHIQQNRKSGPAW